MTDNTSSETTVGLDRMLTFIGLVARAESYFFAGSVEEVKALPPKFRRGMAALQKAMRHLRAGEHADPDGDLYEPVRSAHTVDPISYEPAEGDG